MALVAADRKALRRTNVLLTVNDRSIKTMIDQHLNDMEQLWRESHISFHFATLADFYQYRPLTRQWLLACMDELGERLWLPDHVSVAFLRYAQNAPRHQRPPFFSRWAARASGFWYRINRKIESHAAYGSHKTQHERNLEARARRRVADAAARTMEMAQGADAFVKFDPLLNEMTRIFSRHCGSPYSVKRLEELKAVREERGRRKLPPGILDPGDPAEGTELTVFDDMVVWLQCLDKARDTKKPFILVNDSFRRGWWAFRDGQEAGVRQELVHEMRRVAGVPFFMWDLHGFLKRLESRLGWRVPRSVLRDIGRVRRRQKRLVDRKARLLEAAAHPERARKRAEKERLKAFREAEKAAYARLKIQERYDARKLEDAETLAYIELRREEKRRLRAKREQEALALADIKEREERQASDGGSPERKA